MVPGDGIQRYGPWELRDGENLLAFWDILHSPREAAMGSCYNTVCQWKVISGAFAGMGEWECDWQAFVNFSVELEQLYYFQRQEVELRDIEWGNWIRFTMDRTGHLTISGHLYKGQTLEFEFGADQTALQPVLSQMKQDYRRWAESQEREAADCGNTLTPQN